MEIALSPMEFAQRARRLYGNAEAVVEGDKRFTYTQFLDRCACWSAALQKYGVAQGDRVAYIAPNTHTHLEGYYAVPQIGAVLVPINYRLLPEDFDYIINHCGATVVCVHPDYIDAIDSIRDKLPKVQHYVALDQCKEGWLDYEQLVANESPDYKRVNISESDLLTINYTSGTTARPKGVMITHRNASEYYEHTGASAPESGRSIPLDAANVPCQRLDVYLAKYCAWYDSRMFAKGRTCAGMQSIGR